MADKSDELDRRLSDLARLCVGLFHHLSDLELRVETIRVALAQRELVSSAEYDQQREALNQIWMEAHNSAVRAQERLAQTEWLRDLLRRHPSRPEG